MTSRLRLLPAAALTAAALLTVTACTSAPEPETVELTVATPEAAVTAAASSTAAERAVETSRVLWRSSPVVVLAPTDDPDDVAEAAEQGERIGAPVLIAAEGVDVATEVDRLGAATVATVATVARARRRTTSRPARTPSRPPTSRRSPPGTPTPRRSSSCRDRTTRRRWRPPGPPVPRCCRCRRA